MPPAPGTKRNPTRGRAFFASAFVVLTVVGVWKFIDYRTQPPPPPPQAVTSAK
jgi:hypothetical protein